ncbi:MAG: hypothetical protein NVS4B3_11940 [Gemmatimonadaceae bacterium]
MPFHARHYALLTLLVGGSEALAQDGPAGDLSHVCAMRPVNDAVVVACRDLIRGGPAVASPYIALGDALASRESHREALGVYENARRLEPALAEAHLRVAQELDRFGRNDEALREYQEYARLRPSEPRGPEIVGWLLLQMSRPEDALVAFRQAEHLDADRASAHHGAAVTLASLGRHEEAVREFQLALRTAVDDAEIWGALAASSASLGRAAPAVAAWEHALQIDPAYFDRRPEERRLWEEATSLGLSIRTSGAEDQPEADTVRRTPTAPMKARKPLLTGGATSSGSGVYISAEGEILTNKHVVRGCTDIRVRTDSGPSIPARVVALDADDDLALVKLPQPSLHSAAFRGEPALRPGDDVVAVGYPLLGLLANQPNVTTGTVSALAGIYNDTHLLQMSAPVQPGSSGGPLFDASGNVVGIVVTKLNARVVAEETGDIPQNVNFAIKSAIAAKFLDAQHVRYATAPASRARSNADVGEFGRAVTVLIECWK